MNIVALYSYWLLFIPTLIYADPIPISVPSSSPSLRAVEQGFLGISFELSFLDDYFGTGEFIPEPIINYLRALRSRTGSSPVRIRIGGNSLDTSTYVPTQRVPMIQRFKSIDDDNQPAKYGPILWDVLNNVSSNINKVTYIIGLPMVNVPDPLVAIAADDVYNKLGSSLDAFLLGNEPDLYVTHGYRPANWTEAAYIQDYRVSSSQLNTSAVLAGPAICCGWELNTIIKDGYISDFGDYLKYIALQHYPHHNCDGFDGTASYYTQHSNVVELGAWQKAGIESAISKNKDVVMSEFNSVSCGGAPGVSDTFAVGSLWTVDYALQLASVGYSAAYIHTREAGISYNLFTASDEPANPSSHWTTNPSFYGVLVTAEALRSEHGAIVVDLKLNITKSGGYAVYDASDKTVRQLVFFNYADVSASDNQKITFRVPGVAFSPSMRQNLNVKYLTGENLGATTNIGWGGLTYANVVDGILNKSTAAWAPASVQVNCSKECDIDVPGPGLAVVFAVELPT